jgi:dCTP deaminase
MPLVDHQIRKLCENGLLTPYDPELINPNSIDVRIGTTAIFEVQDAFGHSYWKDYDLSETSKQKPILIAPQEFFLSCTIEVFNFPSNICGEFKLKSSRAREGWGHSLAGWIDSCFNNSVLTLELRNNLRFSHLPLYQGLKIGQIILFECEEPEATYDKTGRYNHKLQTTRSLG